MSGSQAAGIVVGVDGTTASSAALVFALCEGARRSSEVEVVTAWAFDGPDDDFRGWESLRESAARAQDVAVTAALATVAAPALLSRSVVEGAAGPELLHAAHEADYLVVGKTLGSTTQPDPTGSVREYCLSHASMPVLVVPERVGASRLDPHAGSRLSGLMMRLEDDSPDAQPRPRRFEELTVDECWSLLASRPVGRIGYTGTHGPQVLPVNHSARDGTIVFRTAAYNSLARDVRGNRVAFEVDELDDASATGWSVLAVGYATFVEDPDDLVKVWDGGAEPWAPGTRTLCVSITPETVTGRRITVS